MRGHEVVYACADDTHGTATMLKAEEENTTPEELIERVRLEHQLDFENFLVSHDNYYSTHSEENQYYSELIYTKLNEKGLIIKKDVEQLFDKNNYEQWYMPKKYENINVLQWLLDKCQTDAEKLRVQEEYSRYQAKNFIKVLQFLIYFVDTLRANNIVWGVGRGSSVASFCLFLIGVHKINPMLYNLDYTEFLR